MSDSGYECFATGKFDLSWNHELGFECMDVRNGHCQNPDITSLFRRPLLGFRQGSREKMDGGIRDKPHRDKHVANVATSWLRDESRRVDGPWLLYAGFTQPHPPFQCLPDHFERYPPDQIDLPDVTDANRETLHPVYQMRRSNPVTSTPMPEENMRRMRAAYYWMVAELDGYIGQIANSLEETDQLDNTVVLYTSDHGESLGEHDQWGKSNMYEDAAHIPLIVAGPGFPKGLPIDTAVNHVDLVPTMLDLADGEKPDSLRGHSLLPMLAGNLGDHPGFSYSENHSGGNVTGSYLIREGDWKYIHFTWYDNLLFNVAEDPTEKMNRIDDPTVADVLKKLRDRLFGEVDPEEVTRRAFDIQKAFLRAYTAERTEDELYEAFESRMGPGLARTMAAKCKSNSIG